MRYEYKVVAEFDLFTPPSIWQKPAARMKQYAAALEDAFNRMARDGWQLVHSHKEPWSGGNFFIFQREIIEEPPSERSTAIRENLPSGRKNEFIFQSDRNCQQTQE